MLPREFICADCKALVFSYAADRDQRDRCFNCDFIRGLELAPETEAELRRVLDCELRETDESPGGQDPDGALERLDQKVMSDVFRQRVEGDHARGRVPLRTTAIVRLESRVSTRHPSLAQDEREQWRALPILLVKVEAGRVSTPRSSSTTASVHRSTSLCPRAWRQDGLGDGARVHAVRLAEVSNTSHASVGRSIRRR